MAKVILKAPQDISISGHTDATAFAGTDYGNWELSSDRANSARRELTNNGVPEARVNRVVGKAATDPLLKNDPKHASNRRLSIILLRGTGKDAQVQKLKDAKAKEKANEALPGLTDIKRTQEIEAPAPSLQPAPLPAPGGAPAPEPQPAPPPKPTRPVLPGINLEIR